MAAKYTSAKLKRNQIRFLFFNHISQTKWKDFGWYGAPPFQHLL